MFQSSSNLRNCVGHRTRPARLLPTPSRVAPPVSKALFVSWDVGNMLNILKLKLYENTWFALCCQVNLIDPESKLNVKPLAQII